MVARRRVMGPARVSGFVALMALIGLATGCPYVSKSKYDEYWDADGDGFGIDQDCAPNNPKVYPGAPDVRGDGCDADCGVEPDADGDDWPDAWDCDPNDDRVFPCSPFEIEGDGRDSDCDGRDGVRTTPCDTSDPYFPDAEPNVCGERS